MDDSCRFSRPLRGCSLIVRFVRVGDLWKYFLDYIPVGVGQSLSKYRPSLGLCKGTGCTPLILDSYTFVDLLKPNRHNYRVGGTLLKQCDFESLCAALSPQTMGPNWAQNFNYYSEDSLLAKYPTGLEYFNMEQILDLYPLIYISAIRSTII